MMGSAVIIALSLALLVVALLVSRRLGARRNFHAETQRKLCDQMHAYFDRVADPKWDLWKGGTSKTGMMVRGVFDNPGPAPPPKRSEQKEPSAK